MGAAEPPRYSLAVPGPAIIRVAFGLTNWTNYRTRALLYAGRPNGSLLNP